MSLLLQGFMGTFEGAPYTVTKTHDNGLEEREYTPYKWAATKFVPNIDGDDPGQSTSPMFRRLFNYITGENETKQKIAMTIPVSTWVSTEKQGAEQSREMCFYIGQDIQDNPPKPTNEHVYIVERKPMTILTRKISGYPNETTWKQEYQNILEMAKDMNVDVDQTGYYQNGYDAPQKFINRRNELWLVKKPPQEP
ncbi:hypothetical protein TCAL_11193 [Tigriopus californicus]|uniref:Heme-binding protein 2 n=1 Tax=Tigriopus californicus TaxID=6832 RepID=A0A553PPI4_TIGCA|nr:heme-binding protein 2-like [Tigriopus californicus]XP_059086075.1 heme-binding protein 2-like [Tigriopus californicus]TRY79576.1 hypothetical protein TCAL_11193 [Tigriopus californicus]|eukprot:TCALIF_11193-PA protein Name:"Similar to HEBP2 Heme-binding protein 2 (Homo sapiens)" AED:0.00 eAED:0.00 QI:244/1/1/1/0.6/0.66/6/64/194